MLMAIIVGDPARHWLTPARLPRGIGVPNFTVVLGES